MSKAGSDPVGFLPERDRREISRFYGHIINCVRFLATQVPSGGTVSDQS